MKKIILLSLVCLFATTQAFSQTCVEDVWFTLKGGQIGKAKRLVDECYAANPNNADVLLIKANVYLRRYSQEMESAYKDSKYVVKEPNAIWIANDCFYRAIQINSNVKPKSGNAGALEGQALCAPYIYTIGKDALEAGQLDSAKLYYNTAIRSFSVKTDRPNPEANLYIMAIYGDLALIALQKGDTAEYKKMLINTTNLKPKGANTYLLLYEQYLLESDTVNALKILKAARANVPDTLSKDIYNYEINYFAMINDVEKLTVACDEFIVKFGESDVNLALIANYLNNAGQFEKAEVYARKGLTINPNNFDLLYQMGCRYAFEVIKYQDLIDEAEKARDFDKIEELVTIVEEILKNVNEWSEKAYQIKNDDPYNNRMLLQAKGRLHLPIPDELKAWRDNQTKQQGK